ncbi:hypothetical protein SBA4_7290004 [Candidatus Sulfopaludibacter sp. SbA4]|nr:hypothetical protein SBA4_7290004 [Candidatus Sulfopaludibacter sp. SbA4]
MLAAMAAVAGTVAAVPAGPRHVRMCQDLAGAVKLRPAVTAAGLPPLPGRQRLLGAATGWAGRTPCMPVPQGSLAVPPQAWRASSGAARRRLLRCLSSPALDSLTPAPLPGRAEA